MIPYIAYITDDLDAAIALPLDAEDGLTDLSGNGRNGTAVGGLTPGGYSPGPFTYGDEGATDFDGTDDRITTTYSTRRNLCTNPTFETNITGPTGSNCTTAQSSTQAYDGTYSLRMTATAANMAITRIGATGFTGVAGTQYTASCYVYQTTTPRTGSLALGFYDAGGVLIGSFTIPTPVALTQNAWTRLTATATAPANTAHIAYVLYVDAGSVGAASDVAYVDGILIEAASSAGTYFPTVAQLDTGEAGWLGTAHASASDIGCFANGTSRTFMGWIYRDSAADTEDVFFSSRQSDGSPKAYLRLLDAGNAQFSVLNNPGATMTGVIPTPGWNHVALVFDEPAASNNMNLYVNGALVGTQTHTTQFDPGSTGIQFGVRALTTGPFDGKQAWVSVHERALTADEILQAYNLGIGEYWDPNTDNPNYSSGAVFSPVVTDFLIQGGA